MLYIHFIEKLTGLQGIIINNIESNEKEVHIHCELERKPHKCPNCGCVTDCVHDYRVQVIKDIPSFGKFVYIHLRKRRYRSLNELLRTVAIDEFKSNTGGENTTVLLLTLKTGSY